MRVAVLGAGAVGLGSAAVLVRGGHTVVLWGRSLAPGGGVIEGAGEVAGSWPVAVAGSVGEAAAGADAVLIAVPGFAHRAVMDQLAPHLGAGRR